MESGRQRERSADKRIAAALGLSFIGLYAGEPWIVLGAGLWGTLEFTVSRSRWQYQPTKGDNGPSFPEREQIHEVRSKPSAPTSEDLRRMEAALDQIVRDPGEPDQ